MDDWTVARALDFLADHFQGVGAGVADDGSAPLKIGGVFRTAKPSLADGQRGELQLGARGSVQATLWGFDNATPALANQMSDGATGAAIITSGPFCFNGITWDRLRTPNVFKVVTLTIVAGTPQVVWTPAAGKKFRLMGWSLSLSVDGRVLFDDGVTTDVLGTRAAVAGEGDTVDIGNGLLSSAANNTLRIDASASGDVRGLVWGTEE